MGDSIAFTKGQRACTSRAVPRFAALDFDPPSKRKKPTAAVLEPVPKVTLNFCDLVDDNEEWWAYKYPSSEGVHNYRKNGHAHGNVEDAMELILKDFIKENATLATRLNGVASCVEISEMVIHAADQMGHHDLEWFGGTRVIEDALLEIAKSFMASERRIVWTTLGAQIENINDGAKEFGILKGFPDVIKVLKKKARRNAEGRN